MHIDTLDSFDEFQSLKANWNSIYAADPESQFFLSWIWLAQLFIRRPDEWIVLAAKRNATDADYVAFFPLRPRTRFSKSQRKTIHEIYMAGNFWADFTGYLCHPSHDTDALRAFALHIKTLKWSKLHLENIRSSEERLRTFTGEFQKSEFKTSRRNRTSKVDGIDNLVCPTLNLPDQFERYLQDYLSSSMRQKIRRFSRKLVNNDDIEIVESSEATRTRDLDAIASFWQSRWAERKGKKVELLAKKYRGILEQGLQAGILHMPVLLAQGVPVAVHASFIDFENRSLLFFVAGRDVTWSVLPAGLMLHAHTIRWAIREKIQAYELLRGDEKYKYSLGAIDSFVHCIRIDRR
jgi:CelD/BcsL family acetyltransferase involved in cellulose biosynthesis